MQEGSIQFSEVQSLYELCTFSTDLKKFCRDIGVNYDKYVKWRQRLRYDEETGRTIEVDLPAPDVMSEVMVTGMLEPEDTTDVKQDDEVAGIDNIDEETDVLDETDTTDGDSLDSISRHSGTNADGTPIVKGFDLKKTTLADVICAGRGLDMQIESFKLHMHDGLHMKHTHITLREAIIILHQLNIMYSC